MGHKYLLTLHKTYYNKGFFNLGVSVSDYVREDEGDISIFLDSDVCKLWGRVNRSANTNGTPRIMVGTELVNWFQKNFDLGETVTVEVLRPDAIKIVKKDGRRNQQL